MRRIPLAQKFRNTGIGCVVAPPVLMLVEAIRYFRNHYLLHYYYRPVPSSDQLESLFWIGVVIMGLGILFLLLGKIVARRERREKHPIEN